MKAFEKEYSVERMAEVLEVSRSGYHAWKDRPVSGRRRARDRFDIEVVAAFEASKRRYGRGRIREALIRKGLRYNHKRIEASMRRQNLQARQRRKFRVTTDSKHALVIAPNIINRVFKADAPDRIWVSDITYLASHAGWLYLAVFLDLYSRIVTGWKLGISLHHDLVLSALSTALWRRQPARGLIIHSDRGIQYCCDDFRTVTAQKGIIQSMSRKGDCWDNAVAESFFSTLKIELVGKYIFKDTGDGQRLIFEYIESFYNRQRFHSLLGNRSPAEFEAQRVIRCVS